MTELYFSYIIKHLILPTTLHTSEQCLLSSAKQTNPDFPPKKNKFYALMILFKSANMHIVIMPSF